MRKTKTDKTLTNLMTLLITIIACFLILEGLTRIFIYHEPRPFPPIMESDEELCFKIKKGLNTSFNTKEFQTRVTTNKFGFREEKTDFKDRSIMILGDSFIFGQGVEYNETFGNLMENMLNSKGYFYHSYNFGVGSYGTIQQRKVAEKYFDELKPEIIILAFYTNDPRDNLQNCSYEVDKEGYLMKKGRNKGFFSKIKKWMQLNINLYRVINSLIYDLKVRTNIFDAFARTAKLNIPVDYKQNLEVYDEETSKAWETTYSNLNKINKLSKKNNAAFIILYIPSKAQLDKEKQERLTKIYNLENPDFGKISKNLLNFTEEKNIHFIDLTEIFIKNEGPDNYYMIDPHWKAEGHLLAAQTVSQYLTDNKII